jgi:cytidine deaminase
MAMNPDWTALRTAARAAMARAYAPYSNFPVGAAGLVVGGTVGGSGGGDGTGPDAEGSTRVITGCNVENASYGVGLCAECGLVSALHASGGGRLVAVSIVGGDGEPVMPCGRCRQLLYEAGGVDLLLETAHGVVRFDEVLPDAFGPDDLVRG